MAGAGSSLNLAGGGEGVAIVEGGVLKYGLLGFASEGWNLNIFVGADGSLW